jgi:hypothetical protein
MARKKKLSESPFAGFKWKPGDDAFQPLLNRAIREYDKKKAGEKPSGNLHWYAADAGGQIAVLDGRECGYIPEDVFAFSKDDYLTVFEYFARPTEEQFNGDYETGYAEQGLFLCEVMDMATDGYERIRIPAVPRQLSSCPLVIRKTIELVRFDGVFESTSVLWATTKWKCV